MLELDIIIHSELEHSNGSTCLYDSKVKVDWRTKTFLTHSIFSDYFGNVVIHYVRAKYQNPNFEVIIIYADEIIGALLLYISFIKYKRI